MEHNYLKSVSQQFHYYKSLGEKSFKQLEEKELFWRPNETSNSLGILVNHLWGNMKSRWTDFLSTDGEKEWRQRDLEFEELIKSKEELLLKWEEGWDCLFVALEQLDKNNLKSIIYIRNEAHSPVEAINRQLAHYSYHIGQIVYLAKLIKETSWENLSIPIGQSSSFNQKKFAKGKH
ncbi:DUF1572 family protein [Eudoraea chungangensis]|uniref:DUF1572 family protein n=1 Tax=Eudoraea chungangensis TaxID=1481905 RepID=UPI0023EC7758|nr:DUF1572 family protein [Eudoraea chungangensis]